MPASRHIRRTPSIDAARRTVARSHISTEMPTQLAPHLAVNVPRLRAVPRAMAPTGAQQHPTQCAVDRSAPDIAHGWCGLEPERHRWTPRARSCRRHRTGPARLQLNFGFPRRARRRWCNGSTTGCGPVCSGSKPLRLPEMHEPGIVAGLFRSHVTRTWSVSLCLSSTVVVTSAEPLVPRKS